MPVGNRRLRPTSGARPLSTSAVASRAAIAAVALVAVGLPSVAADFFSGVGRTAEEFRTSRRDDGPGHRRLANPGPVYECNAAALNLMKPPALDNYAQCFRDKQGVNSSTDWSVPGAQIDAEADCWCQSNLTATMESFHCCAHPSFALRCTIDCDANCSSTLATTCIAECPSMCLEVGAYAVDDGLCAKCDLDKCFPVIRCITENAENLVEAGNLSRTCDEVKFNKGEELLKYWDCWRLAPKHSSFWNVMSSMKSCICREDMKKLLSDSECCDSRVYGAGACELPCVSEGDCNSQEAQTCIQTCIRKCPIIQQLPSKECMYDCLSPKAACNKYMTCRPPQVTLHVCDDGRWPEASSGCCAMNRTDGQPGVSYGCPALCETQLLIHLDGGRLRPWWAQWQPQGSSHETACTCQDCPETTQEGLEKQGRSVEDTIWDNGQMMLVDIARREGLAHGPNYQMQDLMVRRNQEILYLVKSRSTPVNNRAVAAVNAKYTRLIEEAARKYGDEPPRAVEIKKVDEESRSWMLVLGIGFACALLCACALMFVLWRRAKRPTRSPVFSFNGNEHVVVGSPVVVESTAEGDEADVVTGAPVTVSAPTKGASTAPSRKGVPDLD